jgi:cystine transport system substrate-binding protein
LPGADQEMAIPFRKGNPKFEKAINDALTSLKQDGTLKKISEHWFGTDVTVPIAQ